MKKGKEEAESTALCFGHIKETKLQKMHDQIAHQRDPQDFEY